MKALIKWAWKIVLYFLNLLRTCLTKITKKEISNSNWEKFLQFVKFGFVGVSNTVISLVTYWILVWFNCNIYVANITGFVVSVLNSYYWNSIYVFKKASNEERNPLFALLKTFFSYALTGLALNNVLLWLFTDKIGLNKYIAPVLSLLITVPLNFIMNKFWAFKARKSDDRCEL